MGYALITRNGHNMYDMASMMQKAIRRGEIKLASYAAYELFGRYSNYAWKRLLIISAEDCYGIMTKEIVALKISDDIVNKGRRDYDKDPIFIAKAVYLLCVAKKNRDACYVACNFMEASELLDESKIEHVDIGEIERMNLRNSQIPDWVFDCHTIKGKMNGKTILDMIVDEQAALEPKQIGLFDDAEWTDFLARGSGK